MPSGAKEHSRITPYPCERSLPSSTCLPSWSPSKGPGSIRLQICAESASPSPPRPAAHQTPLFLRILTTAGIDHERDIRKERLGRAPVEALALSVDALRDKKIDAFFWFGNLPTAEVLDLATTPGIRIKLIPLDSVVPAFQREFGNLYFKAAIQKEFYPGMTADVATVGVAVLLSAHQDFNADLAYQITKLIYEKRAELVQAQREAA